MGDDFLKHARVAPQGVSAGRGAQRLQFRVRGGRTDPSREMPTPQPDREGRRQGSELALRRPRQTGIASRTYESLPVRRSYDRVVALEDKVRVPATCRIKSHCQAVCLNGLGCDSEEPTHFTRMRGKSEKIRLATAK